MSKQSQKALARKQRREGRAAARQGRNHNLRTMIEAEKNPIIPASKPNLEPVKALNDAQRHYDAAMHSSDIVFGIGPAGTGKTWLAAVRAADLLREGLIEKIIVTRPAVEAGEGLGFLPGELEEKYEPYFRPVRDALVERLGSSHVDYLIRAGKIEARPLEFLRGATIKNSWLIADEMQNATKTQMKMLLTRIGEGAKFIINGDPRQCDLAHLSDSGLTDAVERLAKADRIKTVRFTREDIVRHGLVQVIVEAYES